MRPSLALALALSACVGQPPTATPTTPFTNSSPPPARRLHLQVKATERGMLGSVGPMTHYLMTPEIARLLRTDGKSIYFFATSAPTLNVLQINADDHSRKLLDLDPIDHPLFPSSDPLTYLQRQEDLSVEPGVLCLDLHDRPNQPTVTYNIRVDLIRGTQARQLVKDRASDRHDAAALPVRPRLCTPHGPSAEESADGTYLSLEL